MKKLVPAILSLLMLLSAAACASNKPDSAQEEISKALAIDASGGTVLTSTDTHGGFHGDGIAYIELSFSEERCLDDIKHNPAWKQLPLSENLSVLVYGKRDDGQVLTEPYLKDKNGSALFPRIENGYYNFEDRHDESRNPRDDSEVLNRGSCNLTIAIYDIDAETLHFCRFDT